MEKQVGGQSNCAEKTGFKRAAKIWPARHNADPAPFGAAWQSATEKKHLPRRHGDTENPKARINSRSQKPQHRERRETLEEAESWRKNRNANNTERNRKETPTTETRRTQKQESNSSRQRTNLSV